MTKIVKRGKVHPFITGDDVVITKGVKHPGQTVDEAFDEVDDTLDQHQKDIDKLKSNLKYVYSYGGVGGRGSGGSGGGGSTGTPTLFISLNGHQLQSGGNTIVLNEPGTYTVEGSVSNSGGETFYVTVGYGNKINYPDTFKLSTELNRCRFTTSINLNTNGEIAVWFYDSEYTPLASIRQNYIVNPHTYEMKFKYLHNVGGGKLEEATYDSNNEHLIGDDAYLNPFIDISYKIDIPNVTNVSVKYTIGDTTDGNEIVQYGTVTDISNNHLKIYLEDLHRNGKEFVDESNTGSYTVSSTLNYTVNGEVVETSKSFRISLIPNLLYINVKNLQNLLYDSLEEIIEAMNNGVDGIPDRNLNTGTYTSFYCKVYEGKIKTIKKDYPLTFRYYDEVSSNSESEFDWYIPEDRDDIYTPGVIEQVEMVNPISVAFETPGIKKLEFSTVGQKPDVEDGEPTVKYIYIKKSESKIDWYPYGLEHNNFYFKANLGEDTFSNNFPRTAFNGTSPLEISDTKNSITLTDESWNNPSSGYDTTILSLGMQYSTVNSDGAEILRTYASSIGGYSQVPDITLYSDRIFGDNKKICIPTESNFNATQNEQYHLVQIVRYKLGYDSYNKPQYATYLYIDGKLESNKPTLDSNQLFIGKLVLNNVNVVYNLINIQYVNLEAPYVTSPYSIDGVLYQYYLAYKSIMHTGTVSTAEETIYNNLSDIKFDGENTIVPETFVKTVSPDMPIPTMMMSYNGTDVDDFTYNLFQGYANGDTSFKTKDITLYWCDGYKEGINTEFKEVKIPTISDGEGNSFTGDWQVELQGTSTMRNRIKNFSLIVNTQHAVGDKRILMSPNYDSNDGHSFLPEKIWTLKADIADSAHANNTAVGKFVNRNCTPFGNTNGVNLPADISKFVKNTLEGFPILMYFRIGSGDTQKVYYLGVYNFNMGRNSYYNLGYHTAEDTRSMINNITSSGETSFSYSVGTGDIISTLAVGEVQDNYAQFDFHQYHESVLFQPDDSSITRMFGKDSKITGANKGVAKTTLKNFVKSVAEAGAYCFANIGKTPISAKDDNSTDCINRYNAEKYLDENNNKRYIEYVPDISWQFQYEGTEKRWNQLNEFTFDGLRNSSIDHLLQCIYQTNSQDEPHDYYLDFSSVSEYYTICMAFGLVDSILKNMNIKSWDGKKCYVAFYDMDCALGENNAGGEDVSYLAATDYWHSDNEGYVEPVTINYDFWDDTVGKGFDFSSSYLFAIAKYAQAIFDKSDMGTKLNNYPQQFWAKLRHPDTGDLRNANYFIDNFFSSGIGKIPAYLASLNYQVKYLYKGTILDDNGVPTEPRYIANENAFNGTRLEKVKDWLNRRLHFLDVMFNVQGVGINIGGGYTIPMADPTLLNSLGSNPDIVVLSDAFSTPNQKSALMSSNAFPVNIYAPMNTPFIINRGSSNEIFLLCAGTGNPNPVKITATRSESYRLLGSKEFTNVSKVEPFLTTAYQVNSNNIEEVVFGNSDFPAYSSTFNIISTSVKRVKLDIPTFTGNLVIASNGLNGQAIHTLDVSKSGFIGEWRNLKNLKSLNISGVNNPTQSIVVSGCPLIGDECDFSGAGDYKTTLQQLSVLGVSGNFNITNTSIQKMHFEIEPGKDGTFTIQGDTLLRSLHLTGFKKISITGCPNLKELIIDGIDNKIVCEEFILDIPEYHPLDGSAQEILYGINNTYNGVTKPGVFNFADFTSLNKLSVSGCEGLVTIKIPDHKVSIGTLNNNKNLEFVDTFGANSVIELTKDSTFYNCKKYGMRQSWWSVDKTSNNVNITTLSDQSLAKVGNYTRMCVSPECTSLAHTFDKLDSTIVSDYLTTPYKNTWGQWVKNYKIDIADACKFINKYISGSKIDDEYVDDNNIIHDTQGIGIKSYGEDCCGNIVSLQGCFNKQDGIFYSGSPTTTVPNLSSFTNLRNISRMYFGTGINYLSKELLSLPDSRNNNDDLHSGEVTEETTNRLNWDNFIGTGSILIGKDALKYISYRISELSTFIFTIKDVGENYQSTLNTDDSLDDYYKYFDIVRLLCPKRKDNTNVEYTKGDDINDYEPFERLTSFNYFSINSSQFVDYKELFKICPNVSRLSGFLNTDLSRSKIDGILKTCKKLVSVDNSFSHSGNFADAPVIDLYEFFNWGDEEHPEESLFGITNLFSTGNTEVGFVLNKYISQEHFEDIMNLLHNYKNTEKFSNIFSYCTIIGYDPNYEIKIGGLEEGEVMSRITNLNSLFFNCKGVSSNGENNIPLKIRRSFFECFPNVTSLANTFSYVRFDHMFSYDFFCKRTYTDETNNIYVEVDTTKPVNSDERYARATLHKMSYRNPINTMVNCFMGATFYGCKNWFDPNDFEEDSESLLPVKDTVTYNGDSSYDVYYKKDNGVYIKYEIKDPVALSDTINNFTHFTASISTSVTSGSTSNAFQFDNHNIDITAESSELTLFNNLTEGTPYSLNNFNIYPTYCCLPPDILHCCYLDCNLTNVFAKTNIIGVIPQHLIEKCYNSKMNNMFENVNILPNLLYHYNSRNINSDYLNLIRDIPVDNTTITIPTSVDDSIVYTLVGSTNDDATVLFRNSNGELRRRYPISGGEYDKTQFVYVPQGYSTYNKNFEEAFTFRYNLPQQVDLDSNRLLVDYGITWDQPTGNNDSSPDLIPDKWPYYIQYFFTTDESINWSRIQLMNSPFISDEQDVAFKEDGTTGEVRVFVTINTDYKNRWWNDYNTITNTEWNTYTNDNATFTSFLNLCGKRDVRTGKVVDYGCPISKAMNNNPKLNYFVSGILVVLLNGRIFDDSTDGGRLFPNGNGNPIITYNIGFGRNIIFPNINTKINDHPRNLIAITDTPSTTFYEFMFPAGSRSNYTAIYGDTINSHLKNESTSPKYRVR